MLEHSLLEYYLEKNIIYNFSKEIKEGIMEKFQNNLTFTYLYNSHLVESSLHFKKDQELLASIRKFLKQPELVKIIAQVAIEINKRVVKLLLTLEEEDPDFYNDLMYKYQSEKSKKELNAEFKTAASTLSKKLISVEEIAAQLIQFLVDMKAAQNN
jgi:leucyl aminopeptidase (aminopeptidase T)